MAPWWTYSNLTLFQNILIFFWLYFIFFTFPDKRKFELRVHRIMDFNDSKNVILVLECIFRPNPKTDPNFLSTFARSNTSKFCAGGFEILKNSNESRNSRNLARCRYIICVCHGKKLRKFGARCHVHCSQTSTSPHMIMWSYGLWATYMTTCSKFLQNFFHSIRIWYNDISPSFVIFGIHLNFLEFKNRPHKTWKCCSVRTLIKNWGQYLDLA